MTPRTSLSVAALLLFAACGSKSGPPESEFPALGAPATVKLIDGGGAEKTALRWTPEKGATGGISMDLDTNMQIEVSGQSMPMSIKMKMDMFGTVDDVDAAGTATISNQITSASMDMPGMGGPDAAAMLNDMLKGLTIVSKVDSRGRMSEVSVTGGNDMMAQLTDQMGSTMQNSSVPFPEEAIGVGAKWQALTRVEANGMQLRMVVDYELASLSGKTGEVRMTIAQFADAQTMQMQGVSAELKKLKSSGGGTLKFDLSRPLFVTGDINIKMDASIEVMGQSADMLVDARVGLRPNDAVKAVPPSAPDTALPVEGELEGVIEEAPPLPVLEIGDPPADGAAPDAP